MFDQCLFSRAARSGAPTPYARGANSFRELPSIAGFGADGRPVLPAHRARRLFAEFSQMKMNLAIQIKTVWPSGLRRWLKAPFRKGVGSNPTAVSSSLPDLILIFECLE